MAEVQASNDSKDINFDRRKFTFDWATETIIRLQNLTNALESSQNSESLPWHFCVSISDVLDSFFILDEQKDCFDFDCFKHPPGESVNVFGTSYESYHAAVREIADAVVRAIWFPAFFVYDGTTIARQNANVTRIVIEIIPDITAAFCNATNVELKDVNPLLLKLGAGLCTEYPVLNVKMNSDSTPDNGKAGAEVALKALWWHEPTEQRPADYRHGPITGTKNEICGWMGEEPSKNMRRLNQRANKTVWVIRHSETSWEVWFKDERTFQSADNNRRFGLKSS